MSLGEEVSLHVRKSYAGKHFYWDRGFGDTLHWRLSCCIAIRLRLKLKRKTLVLSACEPLRFLTLYPLRSLTQFR